MAEESRSIPELLSTAVSQIARLLRDEIQLARAELSANISRAAFGIPLLVTSAAIMIAGLVLLLLAFSAWLIQLGWSTPIANLLAGVLGVLVSGIFAWAGLQRLKPENLAPKKTLEQFQQDAAVVKEQIK